MEVPACSGCLERDAKIAALEARLAQLEERVNKNSTNSSKPPSSDGPGVKRPPEKKKSGKKQGGQPNRPKKERKILPPHKVVDLKPSSCSECGEGLSGSDSSPQLFQYIDIPPIKPTVIHYLLHSLTCPNCRVPSRGTLPSNIKHHDGPGVHSLVTQALVVCRQSRRMAAELMRDVFGVPMSSGMVCKIQNRATALLTPVVDELRQEVRKHNLNVDETGFKEKNKSKWLWVAKASRYAVYWLRGSRGRDVFDEMVGPDYSKVCTTDRLKTYNHLHFQLHQFCWPHLLRDFQAMGDRKNAGSRIGKRLLKLSKAWYGLWFQVRDGTMKREQFREHLKPIRDKILRALLEGSLSSCSKTKGCCALLVEDEEKLWTFADHEGVEPSNNAAERALRCAAIWRRLSFGTQSESGSRFVEVALSIWQTCKLQGRNSYEYLREAFLAETKSQQPASLILRGV